MMKTNILTLSFWKKVFSKENYGREKKFLGILLSSATLFVMGCKYDLPMRFVPSTELSSVLFKIGGSAADANATGLVLQNNGEDDLEVTPGATSFNFSKSIVAGSTYDVTIKTTPPIVTSTSGTCTLTNASGTATADVTTVNVECYCGTPVTYAWGTFTYTGADNGTLNFTGSSVNQNGVLLKINTAGVLQWARGSTVGGAGTFFKSVALDSSGNIQVGGYASAATTYNFGSGVVTGGSTGLNTVLVKYDSSGTNLSTKIQSTTGIGADSEILEVFANSSGVYGSGYATSTRSFTLASGLTFSGRVVGENPFAVKFE